MNKAVKCDPVILNMARQILTERLAPRLKPVVDQGHVGGFVDPGFVAIWGAGMRKLQDAQIVNLALTLLVEHVEAQPEGKTGLPIFDN